MELLISFSNLEERNAEKNVERAFNATSNELSSLGDLANYWAARNDTYVFMTTGDPNFINYNLASGSLTDESLNDMGINLIIFMDSNGQMIFSRYLNITGMREDIPQNLTEELSLYGFCPGCLDKQSKFAGMILLSNQPMLIATQPIINSKQSGPSVGRVIIGRYLTQKEVTKLSDITQLNLTIYPLNDDKMPDDFMQARGALSYDSPVLVRSLNNDYIAGYAMVRNIYGNPLLILRVDSPREIYKQGIRSVQSFVVLFSVAGILFLILTLVYLDRSVLSRLAVLTSGIISIGTSHDIASRVAVQGKDELAMLASSINDMLTALEGANEELSKSEERYRLITENMTDVIHLHTPDPDLRYLYVSPSIKRTGYDSSELIGKSPFEVGIFPKDADAIRKSLDRFMKGDTNRLSTEYRFRTKDGSWIWVETTASPVLGRDGNVHCIVCSSRDITQRKKAEEGLRESQQQMADIISFLPDAIMAIDLNGKVMIWNRAMEVITGVKAKDMLGKGNYEYSLPFYGIRRPILVDMVLKPHEGFESEYLGFQREETAVVGEAFIPTFGLHGSYLLAKATALYDEIGNTVGAIESIRDMTERRRMEQKLERSRTELLIAAAIQRSFIPKKSPELTCFEVAAVTIPAMEVGGDFYDFISLQEGKCGVVVADVSGKSISAALFMALSRTIIRASAAHQLDVSEVLRSANNMIVSDATAGMFVTLLYGVLDDENRALTYANAGHPPPLLFRASDCRYEVGSAIGIALGAMEGAEYKESTIRFSPGDVAVFYTDGVSEAMNPKGEMYGLQRLTGMINGSCQLSAEKIMSRILNDISDFSQDREQNDDLTLVVLKARTAAENPGRQ